jgi:hypothetical protein
MSSSSAVTSSTSREYRSGSPATKPKPTAPARKGSGASALLLQQQQQQKSLIPMKKSSADETIRSPNKNYAVAASSSSSSSKVVAKSGGGLTTTTSSNVGAKSYTAASAYSETRYKMKSKKFIKLACNV